MKTLIEAASARARLIVAIEALRVANDCKAPSVLVIRAAEQVALDAAIAYARELHSHREEERRKVS